MHKKSISWKLDRLGFLLRLDKPVTIVANEWSQLIANKDATLDIPSDPDETIRPGVILTALDDKKWVIAYFKEKSIINIHLDYEDPCIFESIDIQKEIKEFYTVINKLFNTYINASILEMKVNSELIEYIDDAKDGLSKLKKDFTCFSGIEEDVTEVTLKLKSLIEVNEALSINKVVDFSNQKKIKILVNSEDKEASPKDIITADLELSVIDYNSDSIEFSDHMTILQNTMLDVITKEFCYEPNIKK